MRGTHLCRQFGAPVGDGRVGAVAVAIGRFADDEVEVDGAVGIGVEELGVRSEIAGHQHTQRFFPVGQFHLDGAGTEHVAGVPPAGARAAAEVEPLAVVHRAELHHGRDGVIGGVDGLDGIAAAACIAPVQLLDLHLLDMAGIRQHDRAKIDGRPRGVDGSPVARLDQLRYQAGVVDMGMGEEDRVEPFRLKGEFPVVQGLERLGALEHAAVDENAPVSDLEEVAGAGDDMGGAEDMDADSHQPTSFCSERIAGS